MDIPIFPNPFRPGAGHPPPYLAGRDHERQEFQEYLTQQPVMTNVVLTGLRGVGKTVLLETFKPLANQMGWLWAGTDLSESATVTEDSISIRLLADLAPLVSHIPVAESSKQSIGFTGESSKKTVLLDFDLLRRIYEDTPGLSSDKLKHVLEVIWKTLSNVQGGSYKGIVLAYDEAQNLSDQAATNQYPLSLLLDVFQSLQKQGYPYLLVLTGLPTLFPKLVDSRTFAERMFHVITLGRLKDEESQDAILKPLEDKQKCPVRFTDQAVKDIVKHSGGYPYFIQFLCREIFDSYLQQRSMGSANPKITVHEVIRKLDTDFFSGRWNRVTDRQRDLLKVIATLPQGGEEEFSVQEIGVQAKTTSNPFSPSHITQLLTRLSESGLVYKNRHGRYSFAVPLLGGFIKRQIEQGYI